MDLDYHYFMHMAYRVKQLDRRRFWAAQYGNAAASPWYNDAMTMMLMGGEL